jgi:uridylate kinase
MTKKKAKKTTRKTMKRTATKKVSKTKKKTVTKKTTKKRTNKQQEKNKLWVISLGGSRIVPDEVDEKFLTAFKKLLLSHPTHKFVVVTGGGSTARRYIGALKKLGRKTKEQSISGIAITRMHANFMMNIFGKPANEVLPKNLRKVANLLLKNQVVFCGALRYSHHNTSDGTAAQIAAYLKAPFINLTNVKGLYTGNPTKNKKAKFIKKITWKKFDEIAKKIKYQAGQHFVLDQSASKRILEHKITTYIVGNLTSINNIIKNKKDFGGTIITG